MFTTIDEINTFLQKRKKLGMKPGLERIEKLLNDTGNPDQSIPIIHVAGTNGKGSTIHYIDEALRASCYRTGIFSSPSLTDVRGYFTLSGQESDADGIIEAMNELYEIILFMDKLNNIHTEFENVNALTFILLIFSDYIFILVYVV